jgi:hypothetical protein
MFMRRGSVLVEINPVFFFENRFFEIAHNVGIHYLAWTCTNEDCAFGGNKNRFRDLVRNSGYDVERREFHRRGETFHWPYDRYAGYACPKCDELTHGGFSTGFMALRETDVKVKESLHEIKEVLEHAFKLLKWV